MLGYANPQNLNRYSYATNNPSRYTDPTGHWIVGDENPGCSICTVWPPPNSGNSNGGSGGNGGGGNNDEPSDTDQCPAWNTCVIDVPNETVQDYWNTNNGFLNTMNNTLIGADILGLGAATLAYLTGMEVISAESIALILGISLLDPTPIEEILVVGGLIVAATAVTANLVTNDIQNVNNAIVTSGALQNGGSILANWDGMTITTSEGTTTVNTVVPFSAQISLALWAGASPSLTPGYPTP